MSGHGSIGLFAQDGFDVTLPAHDYDTSQAIDISSHRRLGVRSLRLKVLEFPSYGLFRRLHGSAIGISSPTQRAQMHRADVKHLESSTLLHASYGLKYRGRVVCFDFDP